MTPASLDTDGLAANIWNELPGAYDDRCKTLSILFQSLRNVRNDNKPVPFGTRTRYSEEEIVSKLILKPLTDMGSTCVPIAGISMKVGQVFAVAEHKGHPLQEQCQDFLGRHRIALKPIRKTATAKATMYLVRRNDAQE